MLENLRRIGLYGIGLAVLTEEKIEELVREAVKEGKITKEESKEAVSELITESKKEREKLNKNVKKEVKRGLEELGVPTKREFAALEKRIISLEKEILAELKKQR